MLLNVGPNRSFRLWQDFLKCHESSDRHEQCDPYRLDYLECLHPAKEATRMIIMQEEAQRQHKACGKASEKSSDLNFLSPDTAAN
ncbi:hypothetical protein IWQ62_000636 [Dispira parvispora]|uniref:NADH dehydrogenase [ubiquinone] iron-sulfur protein 5 n=1 Tax=Dispira parvispora TaxID=1520584 RepID=A0A9W8AZN9_9FUNG|nr:hypothetical protein IWQ62_000636 [Dispira parvispora]